MPSPVARPSSTSASASEPELPARPRASASLSGGTSSVAASRSARSSADVLIAGASARRSPPSSIGGVSAPCGGTVRSVKSSVISLVRGIGRNGRGLELGRGAGGSFLNPSYEGLAPGFVLAAGSAEQAEVPVEHGVAPEEREDAAQGEKRRERDRHLAGGRAVAEEEHGGRDERGDHAAEEGHGHRLAHAEAE